MLKNVLAALLHDESERGSEKSKIVNTTCSGTFQALMNPQHSHNGGHIYVLMSLRSNLRYNSNTFECMWTKHIREHDLEV